MSCRRLRQGGRTGQMVHQGLDRRRRIDRRCANPGCLGPAGFGTEQHGIQRGRRHRCGQGARYGDQSAVQRHLSDADGSGDLVQRHQFQRRQHGQCNRQIEMRALLWHVGGGQVDGDFLGWQRDAKFRQGGADAVPGLGHGLVGQTDDRKARQARRDGALDVNGTRLQPLEGDRGGACQHVRSSSLRKG